MFCTAHATAAVSSHSGISLPGCQYTRSEYSHSKYRHARPIAAILSPPLRATTLTTLANTTSLPLTLATRLTQMAMRAPTFSICLALRSIFFRAEASSSGVSAISRSVALRFASSSVLYAAPPWKTTKRHGSVLPWVGAQLAALMARSSASRDTASPE